jgi:N-ethylmaleimide reductase
MTTLFDPYDLAGLRLPNRIVMAPMTRSRATPDGLATPSMAKYYAQRASAGLMISEGVHPSRRGQSMPLTPGLHSDEQVESWKPVTEAVHANGGRIFAQIMHSGRVSRRETSGTQPVGPSAIAARDTSVFTTEGPRPAPTPHALTAVEVASYAAAARHASAAGFDGVELHGANGYLIAQFLSTSANARSDQYGGTIRNRVRFAIEVVEATVDAVGAARVGIRLSPGAGLWDANDEDVPELYGALLSELARFDLAYVHVEATSDEETLRGLRHIWPGTFMISPTHPLSPSPADRASADRWLSRGADLISLGRSFIANPDLVKRLRSGNRLAIADPATYYTGGDTGYVTYPEHP